MDIFTIVKYDKNLHDAFIHNTIYKNLKQLYKDSMQFNVFNSFANQYIDRLLENNDCLVMSSEEFPQLVYGFVIYSYHVTRPVIHSVYVKSMYRGNNLAKILLGQVSENFSLCFYTLKFQKQTNYLKHVYEFAEYNPLILTDDRGNT